MDVVVPTTTVGFFPSNKLWVTSNAKDHLKKKKRLFKDRDEPELKHIQGEVKARLKRQKTPTEGG